MFADRGKRHAKVSANRTSVGKGSVCDLAELHVKTSENWTLLTDITFCFVSTEI